MQKSPLPIWLRRELTRPARSGSRHHQINRVAVGLAKAGYTASEAFAILRPKYAPDYGDDELRSQVEWAVRAATNEQSPERSKVRRVGANSKETIDVAECNANAIAQIGGSHCTHQDLLRVSPSPVPADWYRGGVGLLHECFAPGEFVNVVAEYVPRPVASGFKGSPVGSGLTRERDAWITALTTNPTALQSDAGAWVRINPVTAVGTGTGGAVCDADVTAFRHVLVEFDHIGVDLQIALLASLPLPIAAIMTSGARSAHAWIRCNARDADEYRDYARSIMAGLARFGVCAGNTNPSRLSRLPGVCRRLDGVGSGRQELLYLNPDPEPQPIFL